MNRLRISLVVLLLSGCTPVGDEPFADQPQTLTLATTTSTRDSGLLDVLLPIFQEQTGIEVKVIAVGSGQALELGRRGDADVLLTHAPEAEQEFMDARHGQERQPIMYNDFVLVGPSSDPAKVKGQASIVAALRKVAESQSPLVSRGDQSGTHMKEMVLWKETGLQPAGPWYIEAGAGMAEVLRMADQKRAYALSDRATFLVQKEALDLSIVSEGDPLLQNQYAVILVNAEKHPHVCDLAARQFLEFLLDPKTKQTISEFGVEQYGQPLFFAGTVREQKGGG